MKPTSEEIQEILGPLTEDTPEARQERQRQVNGLVLLISDHRSRALRHAADGVAGSVNFIPILGEKGWQVHNKLTTKVARYLQALADDQLLIKHCRWCKSNQHTSRAHDDAQF